MPNEFSNQVHDFNPGISRNGVFWTVRIPSRALTRVNPGAGRAKLEVEDFLMFDYFNFPNSISDDPDRTRGRVTCEMSWRGGGRAIRVENRRQDFEGRYVSGDVRIKWRARNRRGFTFESGRQTQVNAALVGRERNGRFA